MSEQYVQGEDLQIFVFFPRLLRTTILLLLSFFLPLILLLLILLPLLLLFLNMEVWDVTPCSFVQRYRCSGGICCPILRLPPKHWYLSTKRHGLISRKTVILIPSWEPWLFPTRYLYIVESCFATVHLTAIHFYDPCRVGPSTSSMWCIIDATQVSFLYLLGF